MTSMNTNRTPRAEEIARIPDDIDRAVAAQTFITNGERTLREVRTIRDQAARNLRKRGFTRQELVRDIGLPLGVAINACRTPPPTT